MKNCLMIGIGLLALSSSAFATNVVNKDKKPYNVTVKGNGLVMEFKVEGGEQLTDFCSAGGNCTLMVKGVGTIEVGAEDTVVIEKGALSKK